MTSGSCSGQYKSKPTITLIMKKLRLRKAQHKYLQNVLDSYFRVSFSIPRYQDSICGKELEKPVCQNGRTKCSDLRQQRECLKENELRGTR